MQFHTFHWQSLFNAIFTHSFLHAVTNVAWKIICKHARHSCPYVSIKLFSLPKRSLRTEELCRGLNACVGVPYWVRMCLLLSILACMQHYKHTIYGLVCACCSYWNAKCIQNKQNMLSVHINAHKYIHTNARSETPCAFYFEKKIYVHVYIWLNSTSVHFDITSIFLYPLHRLGDAFYFYTFFCVIRKTHIDICTHRIWTYSQSVPSTHGMA